MNPETYYRDHWLEIDAERLEAYDRMFRWRPEMERLLRPAEIAERQAVLDYGCGPGWLSIEIARRVGPDGRVHALDLNEAFLERAAEHAAAEGMKERIRFHRATDDRIPLPDAAVDRAIAKNVLEYAPDLSATLRELRRVIRPGGRLHVVDSDWGMLAVEPLGAEDVAELFAAASAAYKTPLIGRKLYGALRAAGFVDVKIEIVASADVRGHYAPIVANMAAYARESGKMDVAKIDRVLSKLQAAIADGSYLLVLPQFLVTGTAQLFTSGGP